MRRVQRYFIFDCWFNGFQEIAPQNQKKKTNIFQNCISRTIGLIIKNKVTLDSSRSAHYRTFFLDFSGN